MMTPRLFDIDLPERPKVFGAKTRVEGGTFVASWKKAPKFEVSTDVQRRSAAIGFWAKGITIFSRLSAGSDAAYCRNDIRAGSEGFNVGANLRARF